MLIRACTLLLLTCVPALASDSSAPPPAVPFPFEVTCADVEAGTLALEPRVAEISLLAQLERVNLIGVPLADGVVIDLELTRIDVSRLAIGLRIDGTPAPEAFEGLELSVWTSVDGEGDEAMLSFSRFGCRGWIRHAGELQHLIAFPDEHGNWYDAHATLIADSVLSEQGFEASATCASDGLQPVGSASSAGSARSLAFVPPPSLYTARIAIETDYQLFGVFGSVPAELAYLTTMFAWVSRRYEEQIGVVFTIPYLQIYTTAADPWTTPDTPGGTCIDMIYEFQAAWQGNVPASADLGHFISGVHLTCAAGFIGGLCNAQTNFSVMSAINGATPFPIVQGPSNWDFIWICHEIGHNFNAIHTHAYCPPLDQCSPAGYFGPCQTQQVCTNQGTIMSYCNACSGVMSNFTTYFHTQSAADMRDWVTTSGCLPLACSDPLVYCTAKVNSLGCTPTATYAGHPTLSGLDDFVVRASNVLNNSNGVYFFGSAPHAAPFNGGTLCAAAPLTRTPVQNSLGNASPADCSGTYSYAWTHARMVAWSSGSTLYSQFWSRDPMSSAGSGLTDAVSFTVCN